MNLSFERRYGAISDEAARVYLTPARDGAESLVNDFPTEPRAYFLCNFVACLTGDFEHSPALIKEAEANCPGFTDIDRGDMQRDHMIGIARFGDRNDFDLARNTLEPAVRLAHQLDDNRLACLEGVLGQLAYAEKQYIQSLNHHLQASAMWALLGKEATTEWVELNMMYWLRTVVTLYGRKSTAAKELIAILKKTGLASQARLLCFPVIGVRAYNWLHQHRTLPLPL